MESMAMEMTPPATDACIEVHKSSHLFGKKYSLVASSGHCKGFLA
jgi:hypothetical protein